MIHYLLLKFRPGCMSDALFDLARETYAELARQVPGVCGVHLARNCVERASNADLLVRMELAGREALDAYLNHPLHLEFVQCLNGHLAERLSFDCAENGEQERSGTACTTQP